jgi:hypothetical protein
VLHKPTQPANGRQQKNSNPGQPAPAPAGELVNLDEILASRVAMCQEVSDHLAAALPKIRAWTHQKLKAAGFLNRASTLVLKAWSTLEGRKS